MVKSVKSKPKIHSENRVVMFIDIVSYTKTTSNLDRESFNQLHDIFDALSISLFKKYHGKVIKKIGDAFLITFKSSTNAVLCGIGLQKAFRRYNKNSGRKKKPLKIRVAIHSGEVIVRKGDVYGDAVNTTARIEGITKADDVVFSEPVFSAMNENEIPCVHIGRRKLKGLKYPISLFKVKTQKDVSLERRRNIRKSYRRMKNWVFNIIVLIVIGLLIYYGVKYLIGVL